MGLVRSILIRLVVVGRLTGSDTEAETKAVVEHWPSQHREKIMQVSKQVSKSKLYRALVVGVCVLIQVNGNAKARAAIGKWAADNSFRVVNQRSMFFGGKFAFSRSKAQRVFRVTAIDEAGQQRGVDVKCGGVMTGMMDDRLEVRWHDQ